MRAFFLNSLLAAVIAAIPFAGASGIETAGEVFVDLDAATLAADDVIWKNAGTYTDFEAVGDPVLGMIETTPAVIFDGNSAYIGTAETPDGLVGFDPTRSIEAWVFNPEIASEETIVSWGKRGGPDGTNMAFNYGNHGKFGAVGHWGGDNPDLGWIDNGPNDFEDPGDWTPGAPEKGKWHHLAYTYDEDIARVYSDGVLWNEEDMQQYGGLDTHVDTAIAIASQWEGDGVTLTEALRGSMAIGRMRIHDGVLSDSQILSNYNEEKDAFVNPPEPEPPTPEPLSSGPINRYSFSNPASADASGGILTDSVSGQDGIVQGDGSSFTGTELRLDGGGSDFAAYGDLPNGLISSLDEATIEGWATIEGSQSWSRLFDFGSSEGGEVEEPGGGGQGQDYWLMSAQRGGNISQQRHELRNNDPEHGGDDEGEVAATQQIHDTDIPTDLDEEFHFAAVYADGENGPEIRTYRNGEFIGKTSVTIELGNLNDVNNWLGRSNWTADANFQGTFNEFRIFDYALSDNQLLGNFQAGPDTINVGGLPGDVNLDGEITTADIDALSAEIRTGGDGAVFDVNGDGSVNDADRTAWVVDINNTWFGDSDLNGEFSSGDLVNVFGAGKFETGNPASWAEGDWNGDGLFGTGDLVTAFQDGGFEMGPRAATASVPEPTSLVLALIAALSMLGLRRR